MGSTRAETSRRSAGRSALISRVGILLAVLVLSGAPIASAAPFADKAALEAAVASCLDPTWNSQTAATVGDPTGVACCSKPDVDCGAAGTDEMPDWDVSLVTDMSSLFFAKGSFNADISRWDTSSVTTMQGMFRDARAFNQDIGTWDTSSVTTMQGMFRDAHAFNQHLSRWDVSSVTTMWEMFSGARAFNTMPVGWDTSKVTNTGYILYQANAWYARFEGGSEGTLPSGWTRKDNACDASLPPFNGAVGTCIDTLVSGTSCVPTCNTGYVLEGVTSCTDRVLTGAICAPMFTSRTALKTAVDACLAAVPSGEKCCSTDPHCANALDDPTAPPRCANAGCSDMPEWNTEFVTDMSALFQNAHAFNQDIGNWDVSSVTDMRIMFGAAAKFDGDLSNWEVSSVTDMENMFLNARAFSGGDLSSWNTGKVTKMNGMFADNAHNGASRFNGDLSNWDVSSVTDMSAMFLRAVKFQGKGLSRWDVRGVTSTSNMFNGASVFRGDIMAWDLGSGTSADGMFNGATAWQSVYVDCSTVNCGSDNPDCDLCGVAFYGAKFPTINMASSEWTRRVRKWAPVDHHLHISSSSDSRSAAVSTNGKRIALAADGSQGSVARVYELRDGAWTTQIGSDIAPFSSLHMSAAGNRVVVVGPQNCELVCEGHGYGSSECVALVGCQYDHTSSECHSAVGPHPCDSQSGHPHSNAHVTVYGYHAQDNAWLPVGGEDFSGDVNSTMGDDVALSMDGSRVAMSAIKEDDVAGNHTEAGLVRVYEWRRGEWIQLGQDLRGVDHDERFGATVSLSNDGARLVVASGAGFATAYRLDLGSGRWRQMGDAFPGNSATRACISGDGGTVAVGVTDIDPDPGYVEAYRWSESDEAWTQVGERVRKGEGDGTFARTVSLSHDGETLSVTGVHTWTDDNGDPVDMSYAAVLRWNSFISQWDTRGSSGISMDGYHRHAALSGDGRVLVAGAGVYALSCDASAPPAGGGRGGDVGDCTASLAPGETCTPTCGLGFDALDATCSETGRLTPGSCASSWCEADVTRGGFATGSAAADDIGCVPECVASNTCDCAANEFWDGSACASCPSGSFSVGGAATTTSCSTCTTDEYWDGQACATCLVNSTLRVQAESGSYSGTKAATSDIHSGFDGTGFAAYFNDPGDAVQLNVNVASAGTYNMVVRYAAGDIDYWADSSTRITFDNSVQRTISLYLNGIKDRQLSFTGTGSFTTWADQTAYINLNAGDNTIEFRVDADDTGYMNIDYIDAAFRSALPECRPECTASNTCIPARYVRIYKSYSGHSSDDIINLAELAVWSSADPDANLADGKDVTCSPACSTRPTLPHGNQFLVDGAIDSGMLHTCFEEDSDTRGGLAAGACASSIPKSVEIDLGQEYTIDGMLIVNRLDVWRLRSEGLMVDFMDADRNVKLTTAPITYAHRLNDGFIMDVQAGIQRNGEGEFDAWSYVPEGSISQSSAFDWRTYRWCATDEYWDGSACVTCPSGSFSVGGAATLTSCTSCNADEFWDGSACASCPSGSFSAGGAATTTSCTSCNADEYWNGQTCATCPGGAVGAVDGTMCATIWYSTADPSDVLIGSQGEVTGWTDATGNGYDIGAGAGSSAPTLETSTDGKYAVRVGGSSAKYLRSADTFVNLGLADIPQPFTLMAVIKINSGSGYLMDGYLMDKFAIGIDGGDNIYPYPTTDTAPTWRGTGGASLTGNCGFPSAGWGVHEWVFSNTAGETAIYKADGSAPCIDTQDTMRDANSLTGLTIGEDGAMRTSIIDADVSWREFMIIPGTLTREESARYREYLDDIAYSLSDLYEAYPGHYCTGRNEVGSFTGSLAECAAMCEASPECISFDFDASNADWTSTAQTDCWLSSTCTEEISDTNNRFTLLIKISAKAAAG